MEEIKTLPDKIFLPEKTFNYILAGLVGTFGIIVLNIVIGSFLGGILKDVLPGLHSGWINAIFQLLFLLIPTLLFIKYIPLRFAEILMTGYRRSASIYSVSIMGMLPLMIFYMDLSYLQEIFLAPNLQPFYNEAKEFINNAYKNLMIIEGDTGIYQAIFIAAVVPAICEEFLFRGFLFRTLIQKLKPKTVIIITSIFFAAIHFNPIGLVPLLIISFYLGITAYYTKSILIPIILHFINNLISTLITYTPSIEEIDTKPEQIPIGLIIISLIISLILIIFAINYLVSNSKHIQKI
jgi:membrane protease YdiL (CAAX protease family)